MTQPAKDPYKSPSGQGPIMPFGLRTERLSRLRAHTSNKDAMLGGGHRIASRLKAIATRNKKLLATLSLSLYLSLSPSLCRTKLAGSNLHLTRTFSVCGTSLMTGSMTKDCPHACYHLALALGCQFQEEDVDLDPGLICIFCIITC